ncbi:ribosomal-protein-serine acetyltransferase [Laceyella tengchongensis]|uniref:Ribosomal-protein-serine acetyltransferase n=1 Tax=Laceyella tengchongensis TaxID=574699 RepID=A0AA46AEB5_9BACL|nr:GNAT family protein [Laceyella tengchongensis]SMP12315.1 ribosomal-protein-serine acetyltransferase [Laceyella tengchongensis]
MFYFPVNEQLSLKLPTQADREELYAVVDQNRCHLRPWLPWVDDMKSPDDYESIIKKWLNQYADNQGFQAAMVLEGNIVGMIGFHQLNWLNRQGEIGYWLAADQQGKGLASAAVRALLAIGFEHYGLIRIEIRVAAPNHRSRAIPERLGFRKEGILKEAAHLYGRFEDIVVYGMTATEYHQGIGREGAGCNIK